MYKQASFVIMVTIMLTAMVTIGLCTGSEAHAAMIIMKKSNMTVAPAGGNMTKNATAAGGNMTK